MTYVRVGVYELVGEYTVDENLVERTKAAVETIAKEATPGFLSYDSGFDEEGNILVVTRWKTAEHAAAPIVKMRAWLAENAGEGIRLIRTYAFESQVDVVA